MRLFLRSLFITSLLLILSQPAICAPKHFFKVATIAPAGSVWITEFEKFAQEVSEKTDGEVGFRIYPGGVMGDDQAMLRKMRVGQLNGGGFTMTGISQLLADFRIFAIPFLFRSYDEIDAVKKGLQPYFTEQFRTKRMEFISYNEVGFVYAMSTSPLTTVEDLKQSKSWTPSGDPLTSKFMQNLDITPVQLTIPDVLSSLQTGLVNTVFNSLYGSIVLQWYTKANYITDIPYGYAYGVFVLDSKKFGKMPEQYQHIVKESAAKYFGVIEEKTRQSNIDSRKVLTSQGVTFVTPDEAVQTTMEANSAKTIQETIGDSFSETVYEKMIDLLNEFRAKQ